MFILRELMLKHFFNIFLFLKNATEQESFFGVPGKGGNAVHLEPIIPRPALVQVRTDFMDTEKMMKNTNTEQTLVFLSPAFVDKETTFPPSNSYLIGEEIFLKRRRSSFPI